MQIIAGLAKGRKLKTLPGKSCRPILARIKKSLFDILCLKVIEANFLDLYAGTGSVGIEALSRRAKTCVFIEKDNACIKIIKENLEHCRLQDKAQVLSGNVFEILKNLGHRYDIIFIGPPYKLNVSVDTLATIVKNKILNKDGLIVAQHHFKESLPQALENLEMFRQEKYGDTRLSFYKIQIPIGVFREKSVAGG